MKWSILTLSLSLLLAACSAEDAAENESPQTVEEVPEEVETVEEIEEEEPEETRVSFYGVGDNLIHAEIFEYAELEDGSFDFTPIYRNIEPDIKAADIAYINQETLIGGDERGFFGYPAFNTPSDMIPSLVDLGFDLALGSNNHTLDMGPEGIRNTLEYWGEYEDEILFTGAFESQEHRDEIPIIERNGLKFSILTYTYGTNGIVPDAPYRVNYFDPELIRSDVARAKEISDFVMVGAHWGDEHSFTPNHFQLDYAQLLADLEVDVVLGTHTHTIQPMEWVEGENGNQTLVMYSTGNIVASTIINDMNLLGSTYGFDFVYDGDDYYIDNVYVEPIVIHYEATDPNDLATRTDFEVVKLKDYDEQYRSHHALNTVDGMDVSQDHFYEIVHDVYSEEFLRTE